MGWAQEGVQVASVSYGDLVASPSPLGQPPFHLQDDACYLFSDRLDSLASLKMAVCSTSLGSHFPMALAAHHWWGPEMAEEKGAGMQAENSRVWGTTL